MFRFFVVFCFFIPAFCFGQGQVREHFISAEEVVWDYAPSGLNLLSGKPFDEDAQVFVQQSKSRIGKSYVKVLYRAYSDASFSSLLSVDPKWEHLGFLGPLIHAEVGDTIKVVFKNNGSRPYSMHPHGVFYAKNAEGAPYADGTSGLDKVDDVVQPGQSFTYIWQVPESAGPGPNDPSSIPWLYHSHVVSVKDTNSGLVGVIVVSARGKARADGSPKGVDREFVSFFSVTDENVSWFIDENVKRFVKRRRFKRDDGFVESNLMHGINGFVYGNLPGLEMKVGDRTRWYLLSMGSEVDLHTPHWHGSTGLFQGRRVDVLELLPASMKVVDIVADNPGTWMFHCHVNDHIVAGMAGLYSVVK